MNDTNLAKVKDIIKILPDEEVWLLYAHLASQLKERGLIRTKNIVGERGEFLTIETYKKNPKLPVLQAAPEGTQNIDAISRKGERYSIKTISLPNRTTGVFHGLAAPGDVEIKPNFEYLIVVFIDGDYNLRSMYEISWELFLKYKRWHSRMQAWNITLTKPLIEEATLIAAA